MRELTTLSTDANYIRRYVHWFTSVIYLVPENVSDATVVGVVPFNSRAKGLEFYILFIREYLQM